MGKFIIFHVKSEIWCLFRAYSTPSHTSHLKVCNRKWLVIAGWPHIALAYSGCENATVYLSIPLLLGLVDNRAAMNILLEVSRYCAMWFLCQRQIRRVRSLLALPMSGSALFKWLS